VQLQVAVARSAAQDTQSTLL